MYQLLHGMQLNILGKRFKTAFLKSQYIGVFQLWSWKKRGTLHYNVCNPSVTREIFFNANNSPKTILSLFRQIN